MSKWSRKADACISCGTIQSKHHAKGLCYACYAKQPKRAQYMREYYKRTKQKPETCLYPAGSRVWAKYTGVWVRGVVVERGDTFATVRLDGGIAICYSLEGFNRLRREMIEVLPLPRGYNAAKALQAVDYLANGFDMLAASQQTGMNIIEIRTLRATLEPMIKAVAAYHGFIRECALYEIREQWLGTSSD